MMAQEKTQAAKALIKETFPDYPVTDEEIDKALKLCLRDGEVHLDGNSLVAWLWYWPTEGELVADMNFDALANLNRLQGPLLHFLVWVLPDDGSFKVARRLIRELNPYGVSRHIRRNGEWKFSVKQNKRWREEERLNVWNGRQ